MKKLINCLTKRDTTCMPIWFMRQAGRYLPEFREIRAKNPDFMKLCLNSNLSSKITLQPIKRFNIDAAIIFSDILVVPYALGQDVNFKKNEGPKLTNFNFKTFINNKEDDFVSKLKPVYDAIKKTKKKLKKNQTLISFVGAPWTLLIYMLEMRESKSKLNIKKINENKFDKKIIIDELNKYLCLHIKKQQEAGADVIQIFDSWAGLIPENKIHDYCYKPNLTLVDFCKKKGIPVICFPKGLREKYKEFLEIVKPDGLNIDYEVDPIWAKKNLKDVCLQGGLDPKILLGNENEMFKEIDKYLNIFKDSPYIFNLGHGLLPETNPDVLAKVIKRVNLFK